MSNVLSFLTIVGHISAVIVIITVISGLIFWFKGILPVLYRLGNGLATSRIAIFAKGDNLGSLRSLLVDSGLFPQKNIVDIPIIDDMGKSEGIPLFLVYWPDWGDQIDEILDSKKDKTALIVYAPQHLGFLPKEKMSAINEKRNAIVVNMRGRLLNDIVSSIITRSYERKPN